MQITKELHQAIVETTNELLDTNYELSVITKIAFDSRMGGYFDVYKSIGKVGHAILASTAVETVRKYHPELSEQISDVLRNASHEQQIYKI